MSKFDRYPIGFTEQLEKSFSFDGSAEITPSDTGIHPYHGLFVGVGGDVAVVKWDNQNQIFKNVPSGFTLPISVKRIKATGTTATDIYGLKLDSYVTGGLLDESGAAILLEDGDEIELDI